MRFRDVRGGLSAASALAACSLLGAFGASEAHACGPNFPERLLLDRNQTMCTLVDGTFAHEATHLVPREHAFAVVMDGKDDERKRIAGGADETRLYDEGALRWYVGDLAGAAHVWRALLTLPKNERQARSTWAAYMLGRATGDARWFEKTRALAMDGNDDALGLAHASYGEEARLVMDRDPRRAIRLYAQQAALDGSETSLLFVARQLVWDDDTLARVIGDPLAQRLLGAYLYSRPGEVSELELERVVTRIEQQKLTKVEAAGELAAAAYRAGLFALARRYAVLSTAPLAEWVKAKLAMRDGLLGVADRHLVNASAAGLRTRELETERAILALHANDPQRALAILLDVPDDAAWIDAAYVAERVLTVDELARFMSLRYGWVLGHAPERLRNLLARRLMRAERYDDAIAHFTDVEVLAAARAYADRRAEVSRLARLDDADHQAVRAERAHALFDAARLLRKHGLEIVGFELDPDWAYADGNFDLTSLDDWDAPMRTPTSPDPLLPGALATDDERARVAASAAVPLVRFHYRARAARMAAEAAAFLHPRTQAYAAVLCLGASWVIDTEREISDELYFAYIEKGAWVEFATTFGRTCPEPAFEAAKTFRMPPPRPPAPTSRHPRRDALRDVSVLLAGVLAFVVAGRGAARTLE